MASYTCPTVDALEMFLLGKLRGTQQLSVASHLSTCSRCARVVKTLSANDELTLALSNQSPPPTTFDGVPQLTKAIEIAQELKSEWI